MYILLKSCNEYDQQGEYFVCAFDHKPTPAELFGLTVNDYSCKDWATYSLVEVQSGEIYDVDTKETVERARLWNIES